MYKNAAIIGGGNIGVALATGLLRKDIFKAHQIYLTRRRIELLEDLQDSGILLTSENILAVNKSELIILAVKPQHAPDILREISSQIKKDKHTIISLVTGMGTQEISGLSGLQADKIFLAMPNTALSIGESMTCIAHTHASEKDQAQVIRLFDALGQTLVIPEDLMGSATVLAACGIAFALRFLRSISQGGIEIGFGADISTLIAAQTLKGAARLAQESGNHPEREIDKVTTPMGITISGLNEMEHNGFSSALIKGLISSYNKIEKLKTGNSKE